MHVQGEEQQGWHSAAARWVLFALPSPCQPAANWPPCPCTRPLPPACPTQVFVGGQHVGGCDDTVAALNSGKLKTLLEAAGVHAKL